MNPIKIPKKIINNNIYYLEEQYNSKIKDFAYIVDNRNVDSIINNIENNNNYHNSNNIIKNLLYFFIKLFETNNIENPLSYNEGGIPENGFEFINKNTGDGLGIYHCHISNIDKGVLLWYFIIDDKNILKLKFDYITHPDDDYKSIITNIYNNKQSFNIYTGKFLNENKNLLNFNIKENIIIKYNRFIKYIF